MSRKKWFAAAVMLPLVFSVLLAGCGGGGGGNNEGGNAAAEDKPTLKLLRNYMADDYNSYPVNQFLEEATGYKLQNDMLPQENPDDKLNLIMASNSDYDLVDAMNKQVYFNFAQNGALTDLTPLIDQYGPNIKKAVSPKSFAGVTVDGKIYGIPTLNVSYVRSGLLIRTDWLEKAGKKMPTTLDEFVDVLKAFKDQDPGGNGANNIPMTIDAIGLLDNLTGAYGIFGSWTDVDGKLVNVVDHPGLKDYITFIRNLYDQGLIDKEFATNKSATAAEKFTSGRAGIYLSIWSSIPSFDEALQKNVPGATYQFIPPLKGPNGQSGFIEIGGFNKITFVPKSAKHPEDAIKLVNAMLDPNTFKELFIGKEGETYTMENGNYMPIDPAFFDDRAQSNNFVIGMDEANFVQYWQARLQKSKPMFDNYKIINSVPQDQIHMDPLAFASYLPKYSANSVKLGTLVNDGLIKMIVDGVSDNAIADLQKAWRDAGGQDVEKEVNDWYASQQ